MSTTSGAVLGMLGHALHYGLLVGGLAGVGVLLGVGRPGRHRPQPLTLHDRRVAVLREAAESGQLGADTLTSVGVAVEPVDPPEQAPSSVALAVVGGLGAAGVHAAVIAPHLDEGPLVVGFFALVAVLQLCWAIRLVCHPSTVQLLLGGVLLHATVTAVWFVSRTVGVAGLPVEAVGVWDVAAACWQVLASGACLVALQGAELPAGRLLLNPGGWPPAARVGLSVSASVMLLLTVSGLTV